MIDLRKLREDTDYRSGIIHKGVDEKTLDKALDLDTNCRALQAEVEQLRSDQNRASKDIGKASPEEREEKITNAAKIKAELQKVEAKFGEASDELREIAITIPNPADPRCPTGGEDDYEVIEVVGEQIKAPAMDHAEYGHHMGWVEKEKAAEARV